MLRCNKVFDELIMIGESLKIDNRLFLECSFLLVNEMYYNLFKNNNKYHIW